MKEWVIVSEGKLGRDHDDNNTVREGKKVKAYIGDASE